jgi:UDP-N-acetylglucosamine 2-epimerase (hydrolysing)
MLNKKKVIFVTSTRADFGKLKSLIKITKTSKNFDVLVVVTGMHLLKIFGNTYREVVKTFKKNIIKFKNQNSNDKLEVILYKTVKKFSEIVNKEKPDLIVIHGDRVEALACATVGALNHILTAHVEGGEISGTIDDSIRHSITKLCHIHFVGNRIAEKRVLKMGEKKKNIFRIGSPDIDIILNNKLPSFLSVKNRYDIKYKNYAILLWHPVTSEIKSLENDTKKVINFCKSLNDNYIVIYPNNDPGSSNILNLYKLIKSKKFKILKSLRFEHFLSLLKYSKYIIGNSSSAIYEAPLFGTPGINIGNRQHKRFKSKQIKNFDVTELSKNELMKYLKNYETKKKYTFGQGKSDKKFYKIINEKKFWSISTQKFFNDK